MLSSEEELEEQNHGEATNIIDDQSEQTVGASPTQVIHKSPESPQL